MSRFEIALGPETAILAYRWLKGDMVLMHTLVPDSAKGTGAGTALVVAALQHAAAHHLHIIAYCSFAAKYIERHEEYKHLLANQ